MEQSYDFENKNIAFSHLDKNNKQFSFFTGGLYILFLKDILNKENEIKRAKTRCHNAKQDQNIVWERLCKQHDKKTINVMIGVNEMEVVEMFRRRWREEVKQQDEGCGQWREGVGDCACVRKRKWELCLCEFSLQHFIWADVTSSVPRLFLLKGRSKSWLEQYHGRKNISLK